jgi:hypothetical protein
MLLGSAAEHLRRRQRRTKQAFTNHPALVCSSGLVIIFGLLSARASGLVVFVKVIDQLILSLAGTWYRLEADGCHILQQSARINSREATGLPCLGIEW